MTKPVFHPGPEINTLNEFAAFASQERPIYFRHKVTIFAWYQNWSIHLILFNIRRGYLRQALPIEVNDGRA